MRISRQARGRDRRRARATRAAVIAAAGLVLAGILATPNPSPAQGLNPLSASSNPQPIDITADNGIEWQQDKHLYVARGNAVAVRGTSEVHADTLTAYYRPSKAKNAEGGNEVYRLQADGHVVIKAPNRTVVGDQAIYDVDQQIGIVTGQHLQLTTPTDIVTARDSLEWYDQQQVAVARGDAIAIRGNRRIRADVLTAHFVKDNTPPGAPAKTTPAAGAKSSLSAAAAQDRTLPPGPARSVALGKPEAGKAPLDAGQGNSKISRIDAQGHVVIVTATDIARGDYGVYNAQTGIATLLGNVTITRGQDTLRGQYAVVDLNTNISRIMTVAAQPGAPAPRVEGLFYRQDVNSGAKSGGKPAAKPAAAGAKS
jgi:lipopolysaccharide export system protein LptA